MLRGNISFICLLRRNTRDAWFECRWKPSTVWSVGLCDHILGLRASCDHTRRLKASCDRTRWLKASCDHILRLRASLSKLEAYNSNAAESNLVWQNLIGWAKLSVCEVVFYLWNSVCISWVLRKSQIGILIMINTDENQSIILLVENYCTWELPSVKIWRQSRVARAAELGWHLMCALQFVLLKFWGSWQTGGYRPMHPTALALAARSYCNERTIVLSGRQDVLTRARLRISFKKLLQYLLMSIHLKCTSRSQNNTSVHGRWKKSFPFNNMVMSRDRRWPTRCLVVCFVAVIKLQPAARRSLF